MSGLGVVGPYGLGARALAEALASDAPPPLIEIDRSAGYHRRHGARLALSAAHIDLSPLLPANAGRRMSPPARFAVAAARLALADAGLENADFAATAVVSGTAWGPTSVTEQLLLQIFGPGPESASPALFTESVASAAASQVALALRARGPNIAINQREASDLLAVGEAMRLVASARADRALVIVVDEMIPILHAALDRFGALAQPDADGVERARPFDLRRDGLLAAEGATAVVVEPAAAALARGGRARVRLLHAGAAFDATAAPYDFGSGGERLARRLSRDLGRAGVGVDALGLVVSGAAGTRRGDRLEASLLRALFGAAPLPPLLAPKARTGEYGGGFLAAALLAAQGEPVAPLPGGFVGDPELGVRPVARTQRGAARRTLVSTCAAGGAAAWLIAGSAGDEPSGAEGV